MVTKSAIFSFTCGEKETDTDSFGSDAAGSWVGGTEMKGILDQSKNARVIQLYKENVATTYLTFHLMSGTSINTNYSVPSGKVFKPIGFEYRKGSNFGIVITIAQCNVADGSTGEVTKVTFVNSNVDSQHFVREMIPDMPSFAATRFVNMKVSTLTGGIALVSLWGVEEDV